jgi:signal transduction histidine kinase
MRQQQLEAATRMAEAANLAKTSFLANMSNELRTPLNTIIGYSEILQEMAQDDGLNDYAGDLVKIQSAGRHLLKLISDILDLSKIEAGKMELHLEDIDLTSMVDEIRSIAMPMVVKNGNAVYIHCPSTIGHLYSDRTKLKQSLVNLLSNACKFTSGGVVKLTVERAVLAPDSPVTFRVSDTGIGMTPQHTGKLFTPFSLADTSTTQHYEGTGMGLAITRHFCELLGGSVDVQSVVGKGSTFTMVMPSRIPVLPPAAVHKVSAAHSRTTAGRALDVDEADSHALAAIAPGRGGWRVVEAGARGER